MLSADVKENAMQHNLIDTLQALVSIPSPTGYTERAERYLMDRLTAMGFAPKRLNKGGVLCSLPCEHSADKGLLLSAHLDTLGLMVRAVKSNGRLRFTQLGGFPLQYVEQENVLVHMDDQRALEGTVRMNEPAVHGRRDLDTAARTDETMEIVLDAPVFTRQDTEKLGVRAGNFISLAPRFTRTELGYIKSRHMDDKASCALLLALAEAVAAGEVALRRPVHLLFTCYEEVGHGAAAAHPQNIVDMIAVDMGVVADDLGTNEHKVSICVKDSGGPYHHGLTQELVSLAQKNNLPYATDIYPYYGSDAGCALRAGYDYRCALIGTGVAASHGYERIHEEGLFATLALLKAYLREGKIG